MELFGMDFKNFKEYLYKLMILASDIANAKPYLTVIFQQVQLTLKAALEK